jgi:hypothetical protein
MSENLTPAELRNMQVADLRREIAAQDGVVRKMRLGILMKKEKDTAKYRREKRLGARMKGILSEKGKELQKKAKNPKVSPSARRATGDKSASSPRS